MEIKKTALYPGCSLESSATNFAGSLHHIFKKMDLTVPELTDWTCCGATSAHALNHDLFLGLCTKNLALAEDQGFEEIIAPCAACYHHLADANFQVISDTQLLQKINKKTGLQYQGKIKIRNILDFFYNVLGPELISKFVEKRFTALKVACYYGCLNTRVPHIDKFDVVEYPMAMDNILNAIGIKTVPWAYKTECCGAGLFVTKEEITFKLVAKILQDALARGADCIVVSCPMCQNNLDIKQDEIIAKFGIEKPLPILFLTQIIGMAYGLSEKEVGLQQNCVPFQEPSHAR